MRIVYFTHSLSSCWNHGNAHFLRGILRELRRRGHDAIAVEPADGWSRRNLLREAGEDGDSAFRAAYPDLSPWFLASGEEPEALVEDADLVVVHEWNEPALVAAIGRLRKNGARFRLLFHDTHHRAVSDPEAIRRFDLSHYDGVLAFGETLSDVYRGWGWGSRVWTWHEAADLSHFCPPEHEGRREGLVWIGNWGDGERTAEIEEFLLRPASRAGLRLDVHGVRYPADALSKLKAYGAHHRGWIANAAVPGVFSNHLATVYVPRRHYASALPGIPTIRVFEALACGIPLVSAPWSDSEGLFRPGTDYLVAADGEEASRHLATLARDGNMRSDLARNGLETIRARHGCSHRVDALLAILASLGMEQAGEVPA